MLTKPNVIFVLGPPGSGKGTQCELMTQRLNIFHLSAGELLRQEMESGSKHGKLIDQYIREGGIVPVEITLELLKNKMKLLGWNKWFLIDGFPRNYNNFDGWNQSMATIVDIKRVLFIEASQETCISRILKRGESSQRTDDNIESLKKRFQTYKDSTYPIIEHFKKFHLVSTISGEEDPEIVYKNVWKALKEYTDNEGLGLTVDN